MYDENTLKQFVESLKKEIGKPYDTKHSIKMIGRLISKNHLFKVAKEGLNHTVCNEIVMSNLMKAAQNSLEYCSDFNKYHTLSINDIIVTY